jgi:hypothetical protein
MIFIWTIDLSIFSKNFVLIKFNYRFNKRKICSQLNLIISFDKAFDKFSFGYISNRKPECVASVEYFYVIYELK